MSTLIWRAAAAGRWTARIAGCLMVLFVLAFLVGEGPPSPARMTAREQLFALGMGCLYGGLVLAWFRPVAGGLLSVAGWGFLWAVGGKPEWSFPFSFPAVLGVLHVLSRLALRGSAPPPLLPQSAARPLWLSLWVALAAFVLLSANEIFGSPPLMATPRRPPADVVGSWHATLPGPVPVLLAVAPDGSVSGRVGDTALARARLTANRSWFGRLMGWRTAYVVRGELSRPVETAGAAGDRFSLLLDLREGRLTGELSLTRPGSARPLHLVLTKMERRETPQAR